MKNDLNLRVIQSLFNLVATVVFIIVVSVIGKVFFLITTLALWGRVCYHLAGCLHGIKVGSYTGGVGGRVLPYLVFLK